MLFRNIIAGVLLNLLMAGAAFAQCGTQAPANRFCGNDTGSTALATWKTVPTGALSPIAGGTVLGNRGTSSAVPSPLTNPVLGIPGTSTGEVGLAGATSGTATLRAQAAAGSAVSLLPTAAGTLVGTSAAPLSIDAVTGQMSIIGAAGTVLAGAAPAFTATPVLGVAGSTVGSIGFQNSTSGTVTLQPVTGALGTVTIGIPAASGTMAVSVSSPLALNATTGALSITGLAGGVLAGSGPAFTITPVLGVPGASQGSLGFAGATSGTATVTAQATAGTPTITLPNTSGTVAVGASTPLVLSATTGGLTCPTCVTSSGGGAITGTAPIAVSAAGVVSINAPYTTLTASNGGIVYSGSTNLAILAGTATAGQMLRSGSSAAPTWSTATWPATTSAGTMLVSATANTVTATATPVLGVAGTTVGTLGFQNATSGTITLSPPTGALGTVTLTMPAATDQLVARATTDTLTNKTYNAQGTGNVFQLDGVTVTGKAANSDYLAGTSTAKLIAPSVIYQAETTTTFGATTTFDFQTFINTAVTLTGNITTMTLSGVTAGKAGSIAFIQDGTGSRTTVWNSIFKFAGGVTPTLSTTASAVDVLFYSCRSATNCPASLSKDVK